MPQLQHTPSRAGNVTPRSDEAHRINGGPQEQAKQELRNCVAQSVALSTMPISRGMSVSVAVDGTAPTMTSRDIAELTGKRHDNVLADARKMLAELHGEGGVLSFEDTQENPQNGQRYPVLRLPKRETLILVSGYSVAMRAKIIDRWQELETGHKVTLPNFGDPVAAARAWADSEEARQRLQVATQLQADALARQAPKVEYADAILNAENTITVADAAKTIGAPVRKLQAALKEAGIVLQSGAPASRYIAQGYLVQSTFAYPTKTRGMQIAFSARVTGRGLEFLRRCAIKRGLITRADQERQERLL